MNFLEISPYVFGTSLTWYSVFVLMGALVTYMISDFLYKRNAESKKCPDLILNTFLVAFPSGLLGARIWYVLSEWDYYFDNPIEILKVWEGGLAIQGGVMLGAAVGIWYAIHKMRKHGVMMKITKLMDMVIPNILIAQVIGRWGNFFNREVYGACVDGEKLDFLPSFIKNYMRGGFVSDQYIACPVNKYAQPLFLYEGLLNLLGFILISIVLRKFFTKRVDGTLTALYLIWYGTIRACLEGLRNEMFIMRWGNVSQSVVTSIAFVIIGVGLLIYFYVRDFKNKKAIVEEVDKKSVLKEETATEEIETIVENLKENAVEATSFVENKEPVKKTVKKATSTSDTSKSKIVTSTTKKTNSKSQSSRKNTTKKTASAGEK